MLRTMERISEKQDLPAGLIEWLPSSVYDALLHIEGAWEELHLRVGRVCAVTVAGENRRLPLSFSREDMNALIEHLCGGSLYAFRESINQGYLSLGEGVRVGLCGRAYTEGEGGGEVLGVREIDTVCIRLPRRVRSVGRGICAQVRSAFPRGTLFYAPPGVGKTTLLRALALHFSSEAQPLRVAVVDTRCELFCESEAEHEAHLSVLSGYPRGRGIEIATRTLNAQLILCDEIGNAAEATALLDAANCGIPVLASAHASDVGQLLSRPGFTELHRAGVFGLYVGIARLSGRQDYQYRITRAQEV